MNGHNRIYRTLELARDMVSYVHHSGFPVYDGGHTEPEEACNHHDCTSVREATQLVQNLVAVTRTVAAQPVSEQSVCHRGICAMEHCTRCGPILGARKLIEQVGV